MLPESSFLIVMANTRIDERLRSVSKTLFGSSARLQAAAYIESRTEVFAREMARDLGMAENEAGRELRHFSNAGLLEAPSQPPGGRQRQIYRRRDSTFWSLAQQLVGEIRRRRR
jgi:predicted ArsR family transcriptional regulator